MPRAQLVQYDTMYSCARYGLRSSRCPPVPVHAGCAHTAGTCDCGIIWRIIHPSTTEVLPMVCNRLNRTAFHHPSRFESPLAAGSTTATSASRPPPLGSKVPGCTSRPRLRCLLQPARCGRSRSATFSALQPAHPEASPTTRSPLGPDTLSAATPFPCFHNVLRQLSGQSVHQADEETGDVAKRHPDAHDVESRSTSRPSGLRSSLPPLTDLGECQPPRAMSPHLNPENFVPQPWGEATL